MGVSLIFYFIVWFGLKIYLEKKYRNRGNYYLKTDRDNLEDYHSWLVSLIHSFGSLILSLPDFYFLFCNNQTNYDFNGIYFLFRINYELSYFIYDMYDSYPDYGIILHHIICSSSIFYLVHYKLYIYILGIILFFGEFGSFSNNLYTLLKKNKITKIKTINLYYFNIMVFAITRFVIYPLLLYYISNNIIDTQTRIMSQIILSILILWSIPAIFVMIKTK
jgi:hypothetical protein